MASVNPTPRFKRVLKEPREATITNTIEFATKVVLEKGSSIDVKAAAKGLRLALRLLEKSPPHKASKAWYKIEIATLLRSLRELEQERTEK
jgi:hypothetical protein